MKNRTPLAILEAFSAVTLWAFSFIFMKLALRELRPITVIVLRYGVGALLLGGWAWSRGWLKSLHWANAWQFALVGAVGITLQQLLQVSGQAIADASLAAFLASTAPAFIVVLAALLLRERLGRLQIAGVALACAGSAVIATNGDVLSILRGRFGAPGALLVLLSAVVWAAFTLMSKHLVRRHSAPVATAATFFFGWLFALPVFIAQQGWRDLAGVSGSGWLAVGYVTLLATVVAYLINTHALQQIAASRVAVIQNIEPLIAAGAATLILGESITPAMLAGGAAIIAGVYLAERSAAEVEEIAGEAR